MSTLQEIKEKWAKGQGFDSWELMRQNQGIDNVDLNIICKEYATQCILASLKKAKESAELDGCMNAVFINKESITNLQNIILL